MRSPVFEPILSSFNIVSSYISFYFFAVLLAVAIPKLDLFISLFGAFCLSLLGIILPAVIESLVFVKTKSGFSKFMIIVKNSLFIIFGLSALVIGTSTTVSAIVKSFM